MVLYINCCARENSRTDKLARELLKKIGKEYEELALYNEDIKPLNRLSLEERTQKLEKGDLSSPIFKYAKQFANADIIVISAPYWDLSFPSQLKIYIENIYVTGIVSKYNEQGIPQGLCKAEMLYYVTTAGGPYEPKFSYSYLHDMATQFLGIKETALIKAEMLDIYGANTEEILNNTIASIDSLFS